MTKAFILVIWAHWGNNSATTVPIVVTEYSTLARCVKAGEDWKAADRRHYFHCILGNKSE